MLGRGWQVSPSRCGPTGSVGTDRPQGQIPSQSDVSHNCSSSTCNLKKTRYRKRDSLAQLLPSACKSVFLTPSWLQRKATSAYSRWTSHVSQEKNCSAKWPTVQRRFLFCILVFLCQHDLLCKRKNSKVQPQIYHIPALKPAATNLTPLYPPVTPSLWRKG